MTGPPLELPGRTLLAAIGAACAFPVAAQDLEPRTYTNLPIGLNFLIAGYAYGEGKLAFDPSTSITDERFRSNTAILAYARSLDAWGKSAKFDVVVPYSSFEAHGLVAGQGRERNISAFGDPRFRFSVNFFGAPALSPKEFAAYRQDLVIGASLQVSAPLGQYDSTKLVNLGNNRWSFKPELGISKAWGPWKAEVAPSVTIHTDNTDFFNGGQFRQAPLYAVQGHVIHDFPSGSWVAVDGTYYTGGRTTLNGMDNNNLQTNTRAGLTVGWPVDRNNSARLYFSSGVWTRTGSELTVFGFAWQHRWGGG